MNTRSAAFAAEPEEQMGKKRARRQKPVAKVTPWHSRILNALQGRQVFQGVDEEDPAAMNRLRKRRAKNRVAKASRKANRR